MKHSAWWLAIAMFMGVALAHGQLAHDPAPLTAVATTGTKSQNVNGYLELSGAASYSIDNNARTVYAEYDRLDNLSNTYTSGPIMIALFVTQTPLVPGQAHSYWIVARGDLEPMPPLSYETDIAGSAPLEFVPDGIYYVYLGVFEHEQSCGSLNGYCLDDYYTFPHQLQVSGGIFDSYTPPTATTTAIEYLHAGFGHYFVTAQADEIAGLDSGVFAGWARTGQTFGVWTSGAATVDVCRFFTTYFAPKSSHFYTAIDYECAGLMSNPVWQYEKLAFKVKLPSAGACPAGSIPLYRLYNGGQTGAPNHRYTTSLAIRNQMIAAGFAPEDENTACVPY